MAGPTIDLPSSAKRHEEDKRDLPETPDKWHD